MTGAMRRYAAVGWVRADQVPSGSTLADVLALRNRIAELEAEAKDAALVPPAGTEDLQHGDDTFDVTISFKAQDRALSYAWDSMSGRLPLEWDDIFAGVAPTMINEASDSDLRDAFRSLFERRARDAWGNQKNLKGRRLTSFGFRSEEIETCIVQLRALGLIRESVKPRSVKDTDTYWRLTPYGDHLMTQLRAIRREHPDEENEIEQAPAVETDVETT